MKKLLLFSLLASFSANAQIVGYWIGFDEPTNNATSGAINYQWCWQSTTNPPTSWTNSFYTPLTNRFDVPVNTPNGVYFFGRTLAVQNSQFVFSCNTEPCLYDTNQFNPILTNAVPTAPQPMKNLRLHKY